jgi:hypothetical protein
MSGASKVNVLLFLAAMCAMGTVWTAISAMGSGGFVYWLMALLLAAGAAVAFAAYRRLAAQLDAQERGRQ